MKLVWKVNNSQTVVYHRISDCVSEEMIHVPLDELNPYYIPCDYCRPKSNPNARPFPDYIPNKHVIREPVRINGYLKYHRADCELFNKTDGFKINIDWLKPFFTPCHFCRPLKHKHFKNIDEDDPNNEIIVFTSRNNIYHKKMKCGKNFYPTQLRVFDLSPRHLPCDHCNPPKNQRYLTHNSF